MTNCPKKMTEVLTHNFYNNSENYTFDDYDSKTVRTDICISDHSIFTCIYNSKFFKIPQLFKIIRDNSRITSEKLSQQFKSISILLLILESKDSNYVAETLVNEISIMVETLAPSKLIKCSKKFAP